jgi:hypothetical protein
MTFFRKYMVLVVGGSIALVLILIVSALLFKFRGEYARVQSDLQSSLTTLERLHQRNPYPNRENVERIESNLIELEDYLDTLIASLSRQPVLVEDMERAAFPAAIERTASRLRALAREREVAVADTVAFGFQRYSAGNLPMQEHVPRLASQLRTIEALCTLLIQSGISELVSIEREVFDVERAQEEVAPPGAVRRPGRTPVVVAAPPTPVAPEGVEGLYKKERFTLTFFASDLAVRDVLNSMIASPLMMVVRNLELRNEMGLAGVSPQARLAARLEPRETTRPAAPGQPPRETTRPALHDDRLVAGRERVRVTMDVDVYYFEDAQGEDAS